MARTKKSTTPTPTPTPTPTDAPTTTPALATDDGDVNAYAMALTVVKNAVAINGTFKNADLQKHANIISASIAMGVSATLVICAEMATIKDMKIYADDNFKGFGDFCEQVFGYKKSNSSAMAAVGKRFLNSDGSVKNAALKGATWTQLDAIRSLDDSEIDAEIAKGMSPTLDSVKSLKARVKALKAPSKPSKTSAKDSGTSTPTSKDKTSKTSDKPSQDKEPTPTPTTTPTTPKTPTPNIKFALIITDDGRVEIVRNGKVTRPRDKSIMNDKWFENLMDEIVKAMPMK